ncbi:hypothetical protein OSL26_22855, partial [Escherichia coli]|nr:hypothetical protein [Escherichia coli]
MAGHHSRYKTLLNSSDFPSVVRLLHFTGSELSIICSLMTTLKSCINLSDIGSLEIQGASLSGFAPIFPDTCYHLTHYWPAAADIP